MDKYEFALFRQLVESAPILFYAVDKNLNYTYINPFYSQVHSISQTDAIGLNIADVIGKEGFEINRHHYNNALLGERVDSESFFAKADGNPHYYHATYTPLRVDDKIVGFTGVVVDTTAEKQLEKLSRTDTLTSISNRREFEEDFQTLLTRPCEHKHGLVVLDIDYFKKINDEFGHEVGDNTLINLAKLLKNSSKETASVYRIGGEEFALLFKDINKIQVLYQACENLRKRIENTPIVSERAVTISLGGTLFQAGDNRNQILKIADVLLYKCKNGGRNQVLLK